MLSKLQQKLNDVTTAVTQKLNKPSNVIPDTWEKNADQNGKIYYADITTGEWYRVSDDKKKPQLKRIDTNEKLHIIQEISKAELHNKKPINNQPELWQCCKCTIQNNGGTKCNACLNPRPPDDDLANISDISDKVDNFKNNNSPNVSGHKPMNTLDEITAAIDASLKELNITPLIADLNSQQKSQLVTLMDFIDCDIDTAIKYLRAANWDLQIASENWVQDHPDHPKSRQSSMVFDNIPLNIQPNADNVHVIDNDDDQAPNDLKKQNIDNRWDNLHIIDTLGNNDIDDNDNDNTHVIDTKGNDIKMNLNDKDDVKSNVKIVNEDVLAKESVQKQFYNFLKEINMENYFNNFVDNNCCDMESIKYFDDDILKNEINISSKIQRLKLLGHCNKLKIEMNKFANEYGMSSLIQKRLAKYGVVTLDILCNQVKNKNDLRNKFCITNNNQIQFLWKLVQEYENINHVAISINTVPIS